MVLANSKISLIGQQIVGPISKKCSFIKYNIISLSLATGGSIQWAAGAWGEEAWLPLKAEELGRPKSWGLPKVFKLMPASA